ncbi:MAG: hypothetical protein AB7L90_22735, partial [Hyphomicrobiaceae bacterium]
LDIALTYSPNARGGVVIEPLYDEKLVLVSNKPRGVVRWSPDYVYTDWGTDIREAHSRAYPGTNRPWLTGSLGQLSIPLVIANGGSGYFPLGSVRRYISRKRLFLVTGAPVFERKVYCVHSHPMKAPKWLASVLDGIRVASRQMTGFSSGLQRPPRSGAPALPVA